MQTSPDAPLDPGACWSCNTVLTNPSSYTCTTACAPQRLEQVSPRGSRDSTLSPPLADRSGVGANGVTASSSSNAEVSVSTPASTTGTPSHDAEIDEQVAEDDDEELCHQLEHVVVSSEADKKAII